MSTDSVQQKPHPRKDTSTPSPSSSGDIPVIPFAEPDPSAFDTGNPEIDAAFTSAFAPIQDDAPVVPSVAQPSESHPGSFDMTAGSPSNSSSMDPVMASAFTAPESAVPSASSTSGTEAATGETIAMPKFDPSSIRHRDARPISSSAPCHGAMSTRRSESPRSRQRTS